MTDAILFHFAVGNIATVLTVEFYLLHEANLGPRAALKRAFQQKRVRINGRAARRNTELKAGDRVEILAQTGEDQNSAPDLFVRSNQALEPNPGLELKLLRESSGLLVIAKPAGQSVHPLRPASRDTTLNAIAARYTDAAQPLRGPKHLLEGGLIHRLDRGTSGVLVCARTPESFAAVHSAWRARDVEKVYLAWVAGYVESEGRIEVRLEHDQGSRKRMWIARTADAGWPAHTSFSPLAVATLATHEPVTLLLIRIHTGVMHQIRATFAAFGTPVLGDEVYPQSIFARVDRGRPQLEKNLLPLETTTTTLFKRLRGRFRAGALAPDPSALPVQGFFLHSWYLRAPPISELKDEIFAPIPEYFLNNNTAF